MTYTELRQTIEQYFAQNWTTTPIQFENVPFTVPTNSAWVRLLISVGTAYVETLGQSGYNRYTGFVRVIVFVPKNTGTNTMWEYVDAARELFERKNIGGIQLSASKTHAPECPYEGYISRVVDIPFWFFA